MGPQDLGSGIQAAETEVLEQKGWGDHGVSGIPLVAWRGARSQGQLIGGSEEGTRWLCLLCVGLAPCFFCIFSPRPRLWVPGWGLDAQVPVDLPLPFRVGSVPLWPKGANPRLLGLVRLVPGLMFLLPVATDVGSVILR